MRLGRVDQARDEHRAGGDVLGLVGGVLADIALGEAELVGEDEGLAVLAQRLPPVLVQRMDRHGEEAELHRDAPGGDGDLRARRRAPPEIISSLPADRDFQMPVLHHRPHIRQEGVGPRRGGHGRDRRELPAAGPLRADPQAAAACRLPGDARVAVWTIVNVENWSPLGADAAHRAAAADGAAAAARRAELGVARVRHARRLLALRRGAGRAQAQGDLRAQRHGLSSSTARPAQAARDAGWEFMGHGFVQRPMHKVDDQRAAIADTIAAIKDFTGKPPRGWESPGLTETDETLDLLAEAGIEYVADWVLDEQPVPLKTRAGDDRLGALHGRDQRRRDQRRAAAALGRDLPPRPRPVRPPLPRRRQGAARDGDLDPPLPHRRAAPDQVSRDAVRLHPRPRRRGDVDRRRDPRLVPRPRRSPS